MNWTWFVVFFLFILLFLPPLPLLLLSSEWTETDIISLWHILYEYFWISSAKPTFNVYVVVHWKLYLHICMYVFSLYRVLILYIVDKCEFYRTRALFVRSHQVNSLTWLCPEANGQCRGCSCHRVGRGRHQGWDKTCEKCQRSHSGWEELQIIPRSLSGLREEC